MALSKVSSSPFTLFRANSKYSWIWSCMVPLKDLLWRDWLFLSSSWRYFFAKLMLYKLRINFWREKSLLRLYKALIFSMNLLLSIMFNCLLIRARRRSPCTWSVSLSKSLLKSWWSDGCSSLIAISDNCRGCECLRLLGLPAPWLSIVDCAMLLSTL